MASHRASLLAIFQGRQNEQLGPLMILTIHLADAVQNLVGELQLSHASKLV